MSAHSIRFFDSDAAIRRVTSGLLDTSLPREDWTHEAHFAACLCLLVEHSGFHPEADLPAVISRYNVAVGGVNDDAQGYHETITQFSICAVRAHLAEHPELSLGDSVNALLASPRGRRDYPLEFYSPDLLFSVRARLNWVEPELREIAQI